MKHVYAYIVTGIAVVIVGIFLIYQLESTKPMVSNVQNQNKSQIPVNQISLPRNYDECVSSGGDIPAMQDYLSKPVKESCFFHVSYGNNTKLFDICEKAGGSILIWEGRADSPGGEECHIYYYKSGGKCFRDCL